MVGNNPLGSVDRVPPREEPTPLDQLERDLAQFHESLKGLNHSGVLARYDSKIAELEAKLKDEKHEYDKAKVRGAFFDEAEIEVYLDELAIDLDKFRSEREGLAKRNPSSTPKLIPSSPVESTVPLKSVFTTAKPIDRKKLTVVQAAEYLGIAEQTVRQWCSERKIPFYKVGSRTFFDADRMDAWRAKGEVKPISETVRTRPTKVSKEEGDLP